MEKTENRGVHNREQRIESLHYVPTTATAAPAHATSSCIEHSLRQSSKSIPTLHMLSYTYRKGVQRSTGLSTTRSISNK